MNTPWIIEFDYDADPDERIEDALTDHLTHTQGAVAIDGNRVRFDHGNDALRAKLRFAHHVRAVVRA